MGTRLAEYRYSGDEALWRQTIERFFSAIASDPVLRDGLSYQVFVDDDGVTRRHIPVWRDQSVLDHLQSQPFFKEFTDTINGFAGGKVTLSQPALATGG